MKDIMKRSEVEGTLMEIYKNKANNGAGDFIVLIGETYIRYDDQQQKYEILTSYDNLFVKANEIHLALIKGEPLSIIQAFIDQKIRHSSIRKVQMPVTVCARRLTTLV
ncbi:MAG: hypothetical protein ACLRL6_12100 [Clostridium sp.]